MVWRRCGITFGGSLTSFERAVEMLGLDEHKKVRPMIDRLLELGVSVIMVNRLDLPGLRTASVVFHLKSGGSFRMRGDSLDGIYEAAFRLLSDREGGDEGGPKVLPPSVGVGAVRGDIRSDRGRDKLPPVSHDAAEREASPWEVDADSLLGDHQHPSAGGE